MLKATFIDGLSGLFNRRYFDKTLADEIQRHQRQKMPLALIMCDIDHFKLFNDHYGHVAGDECIQAVSICMQNSSSRANDSVCRYGGEEFMIILPHTTGRQAEVIAEKIRRNLARVNIPHKKSTTSDRLTMSYGIASLIPDVGTSPSVLIEIADDALYESKTKGRDRISIIDRSAEIIKYR